MIDGAFGYILLAINIWIVFAIPIFTDRGRWD